MLGRRGVKDICYLGLCQKCVGSDWDSVILGYFFVVYFGRGNQSRRHKRPDRVWGAWRDGVLRHRPCKISRILLHYRILLAFART